ncbi:unnamed protein product [Cuscuta campestris]|uniref:Uncharacterized protein n=1 Tax=Cuscuta campestris TaxID=132261 RepID=A0A484K6S7_9ASTE|nr:unnamed protein product [Cuscuta campestris]
MTHTRRRFKKKKKTVATVALHRQASRSPVANSETAPGPATTDGKLVLPSDTMLESQAMQYCLYYRMGDSRYR